MKKMYYKGFDETLQCKGFQFEVGKTYTENRAELCRTGFHACKNPLDVWDYYSLANSRFAEVELDDVSAERHSDSKRCGRKIHITAEIGLSGIISASVNALLDSVKECNDRGSAKIGRSADAAKIGSGGNYAKVGSCGDEVQIGSSGNYGHIGSSGNLAVIGSSGDEVQIGSCGDLVKIASCGNVAQIASGGVSAEIGSSGFSAQIGSCGDAAEIGSSGDLAKIGSCGYGAKVSCCGDAAVIAAIGPDSAVKAKAGSWITLAEYAEDKSVCCVKTAQVDGEKIKENVYYTLKKGEFTEVE